MMDWITTFFSNYTDGAYIPSIRVTDVLEILIMTVILYEIMLWIKNTKAWMLLRGIITLGVFILVAFLLQMHTILFLARESINVLAIAAVVVFQPELRRALEKLGERNLLSNINPFDRNKTNQRFSDDTAESIVKACFDMGSVCTGALIVVEQEIQLTEYEMTGIELDCKVSAQVLINIFEHNTPLHDGALIIRGDTIEAAHAILPLTQQPEFAHQNIGTRHRAAIGVTEETDAVAVVVSEETGGISMAKRGVLKRFLTPDQLFELLTRALIDKPTDNAPDEFDEEDNDSLENLDAD